MSAEATPGPDAPPARGVPAPAYRSRSSGAREESGDGKHRVAISLEGPVPPQHRLQG